MLCRMPLVSLPDDLREQLNNSESGTINNTRGPGVAVYISSDRRARADIYIGLKLDGLKRYANISFVNSSIKFQFSLKPVVMCESNDVDFDPNKGQVITMKVNQIYFAVSMGEIDKTGGTSSATVLQSSTLSFIVSRNLLKMLRQNFP